MRIKGLAPYIINHLEEYTLKKCHVVIDGQNFFYSAYKNSNCALLTGGEYNKYAIYLRKLMERFQKCEVTCHVIFKGSTSRQLNNRIKRYYSDVRNSRMFHDDRGNPILGTNVVKQVLDELNIRYAISEYESKKDLIDLAMTLNCPVISFDIEFCFYRVEYIPSVSIQFENDEIKCKVYRLNKFIQNHQISEEALKVFGATLNHEELKASFYKTILPEMRHNNPVHVIAHVLYLLKSDIDKFRQKVFNALDHDQKNRFLETEKFIHNCLSYIGKQTFLVNYIINGELTFEENDPLWFAKGVCLGHIETSYIDLIKHHWLFGSREVEDFTAEDSMVISLEIIRYIYDLLTCYNGSTFTFMCREGPNIKKVEVTSALSIPKPDICTDFFFKNGWTNFTPLFEVFLQNIPLNPTSLKQIPESAHMIMITLVYISNKCNMNTSFVYSVLLCYVLLDIGLLPIQENSAVFSANISEKATLTETEREVVNVDIGTLTIQENSIISSANISEKATLTETEREVVNAVTNKYFTANDNELRINVDEKTLHQLVQFQHCLVHMNYLNALCASKYSTTLYHKTFNGTFIYNMMKELEKEKHPLSFLNNLLCEAPKVLSLFLQLVQFYEEST